MKRKPSVRIISSGSLEEEKNKENIVNQENTKAPSSEADEEMKRRLYPEMFSEVNEKPSQETYVLQNGVVDNKYKTDAFIPSKGTYKDTNTYQKIDNLIEDKGVENRQLSEEETHEALPIERYEDVMIHSRKPLMPHEYRFLSDDDRVRLTGSSNRGVIYLYNIPANRSNLHNFSLYVHDGQSWRPIPYRNIPVSRYEMISNQLRSLGYMIGAPLQEGFQHWFFGRNLPVSYHNNSQPTVDASQISITDRILPGKIFKLIDSNSGSLREYNFEYERGDRSNNRNGGNDVPIDFNSFEAVPEFSQISRYEGARGLMSNSKVPYQFLIGFALGMGIMHVLHKKKIM